MYVLLNLGFTNTTVAIVNCVIILYLLMGIVAGFKKGFLESSVRLIGTIAALIGAFLLKNPVSVFMYKHLPFFKLGGMFKGVSVLNILIYECIAFFIVFTILMLIINLASRLTGFIDRIFSMIILFGIPNKILGAIVGFVESFVILYFVCYIFTLGCTTVGYTLEPSLVDDVVAAPVLKNTFGPALNAMDEIVSLADHYKTANSKEEYNYNALAILLRYEVISCKNAKDLVDSNKLQIENVNELVGTCKGE